MTVEQVREHLAGSGQILKTRDDQAPVFLEHDGEAEEASKPFKLSADAPCSWAKTDEAFGPEKLRPRIEPWLTALVQSEHLSLLVGSGLTHAAHGIATEAPLPGMTAITFDILNGEIAAEAERAAKLAGRDIGNFEDQIRAANELLRGLEIIASTKAEDAEEYEQITALRKGLEDALGSFAASILEGERHLVSAPGEKRVQASTTSSAFS